MYIHRSHSNWANIFTLHINSRDEISEQQIKWNNYPPIPVESAVPVAKSKNTFGKIFRHMKILI